MRTFKVLMAVIVASAFLIITQGVFIFRHVPALRCGTIMGLEAANIHSWSRIELLNRLGNPDSTLQKPDGSESLCYLQGFMNTGVSFDIRNNKVEGIHSHTNWHDEWRHE